MTCTAWCYGEISKHSSVFLKANVGHTGPQRQKTCAYAAELLNILKGVKRTYCVAAPAADITASLSGCFFAHLIARAMQHT